MHCAKRYREHRETRASSLGLTRTCNSELRDLTIPDLKGSLGLNLLKELARATGLEPATSGVTGRHSNQLSYARALLGAEGWRRSRWPDLREAPCPVKALSAGRANLIQSDGLSRTINRLHDCRAGRFAPSGTPP